MREDATGNVRTTASSKWLTAGPGFGLVVALVGAALSFVVVTYTSTLRDQERLYKSQVAMLASLMDEVDVNRQRAKKNLEEFTKAVALKGDFTPTPERYMVHTWNSVSSSEALTTALAPGMFSYLSQYYEMIENENRRYTQWEDGLYGLVIAAGSWTQEEKRATQANRRTWFRQRQGVAKVIPRPAYPRAEESPRCEPRSRSIEPEDRGRSDADGVDVRGPDRLGGWTRVPAGGRRAPPVTPAQAYPTCRGRRDRAIIQSGLTAAVSSAVVSISCASREVYPRSSNL